MNKVINYDTWLRSYNDAAPHGRFCGKIAFKQLRGGHHFLNEQPHPSTLYEEPPWPLVMASPGVVTALVDQCATGLRGPRGGLHSKDTGIVASHEALVAL